MSRRFFSAAWIAAALLCSLIPTLTWANVVNGIRVWPSPDDTRVVIDLDDEAHYTYFTLSSPSRLVVDLKDTKMKVKLPKSVTDSPVLSKIRQSSPPESSTYRLVFELKKKTDIELFTLKPTPEGQYGHRLVVDLTHSDKDRQAKAASYDQPKPKVKAPSASVKDILIVIDPGHGGEDPGSIGPHRNYEKNATLSIGKKLARSLNAVPGIHTRLTRAGDYYVTLDKRVAIARKNNADLLISVHADAFTSPQPRGASVFVLNTRRANTEIARWVENKERQSELLGGTGVAFSGAIQDKNVNQTLLDLQFSHSQKEGYKLATDVLSQLGRVTRLHNSKPINTSLAVLRSPQIPSILIETGFISNPTEERLLFQASHQNKLVDAISKAVVSYLNDNPPPGSRFAARAAQTHIVQKGEFLSKIAAQYNTSTAALIKANQLKSNTLQVGQRLTIPGTHGAVKAPLVKPKVETETLTHIVKRGEFLGSIAQHYQVAVSEIKRENHLKSDVLHVGQKLKVTVTLKDKPVKKYKVRRGDYLGKIASQHGVSTRSLREANQLKSDQLAVGQVLLIPNK